MNEIKAGDHVMARLPTHGVKWDPKLGWSGTPGNGEATVKAVHPDGTLDLEVRGPKDPVTHRFAPETVTNVPRTPLEINLGGPDMFDHRERQLGPNWAPLS